MRKQNEVFLQLAAVLISGFIAAAATSAFAASSGWYTAENSRFRLISASGVPNTDKGHRVAGVEIQLAEGWKTYWRTPGDGLATEIGMDASENVAEARLLWPAPKRIEGAGGVTSYGYANSVVLPILLKAIDPASPILLRTQIIYGVCDDICIPVEGEAELTIPVEDDSEYAAELANALGKVPYKQAEGVYCSHRFTGVRLSTGEDGPLLLIETAHDPQASGRDLFVERENGLALPPAELNAQPAAGQSIYAVSLESADMAESIRNERLVLTMTSNQGNCETSLRME